VKKHLDELVARYGKVQSIDLDFTYHAPGGDKGLHGGSMLQDHANHEIDYVTYLFGMSPLSAHKLIDVADRYEMAGVRKDGIVFRFQGSRRLSARTYAEKIEIRFDRATLNISTYTYQKNVDGLSGDREIKKIGSAFLYDHEKLQRRFFKVPPTNYDIRFTGINDNFIAAIQGQAGNYLKPQEMLLNTKMSVAFQKAKTFRIKA
jgi:predicted dehydrogenase